jgi:hypothetical protein
MGKLLFLLACIVLFLPEPTRGQASAFPFQPGEYARYGAYFNWHFIWIHSGDVEFNARKTTYNGQDAWRLKAVGKTFKAYDLLYEVRDTFEVLCQYATLAPLYSRRAINHARKNTVHEYKFDYTTRKIETRITGDKKPVYQSSLPIQENTFDLLATAYNFRKFDFNKLTKGQKVPYRMLIDREIDDLYFRYLGKENVKTRTGKEYRCHKVSVYLLQGDFFPEGEYMKVWFTDDQNHLPIQVETEILVGTVKALLIETKSMKYPLTSEIK